MEVSLPPPSPPVCVTFGWVLMLASGRITLLGVVHSTYMGLVLPCHMRSFRKILPVLESSTCLQRMCIFPALVASIPPASAGPTASCSFSETLALLRVTACALSLCGQGPEECRVPNTTLGFDHLLGRFTGLSIRSYTYTMMAMIYYSKRTEGSQHREGAQNTVGETKHKLSRSSPIGVR